MLTLFALTALAAGPDLPELGPSRPPIQLWMNSDRRYRAGDQVRIQVDAEVDGYLLVLHSDTDGRVRILFPVEPGDDPFVRGGRRYEVRDDDRRFAFRAGESGTGLVLAAIAADPWRTEDLTAEGRWDHGRLRIEDPGDDVEADLTRLLERYASDRGFDYDALGYRVVGERGYAETTVIYNGYPGRTVYVYDDYLYCNNWYWRYDGCHRWPYDGGWTIGFGYRYDPWYYGYRYRYGYYYGGYPYYPYYPYYPGGHYYPVRPSPDGKYPVIVGRPRGYTVERRPLLGGGFQPSSGTVATGNGGTRSAPLRPRGSGPVVTAMPADRGDEARPSGSGFDGRPARRARPSSGGVPRTRESGGVPSWTPAPVPSRNPDSEDRAPRGGRRATPREDAGGAPRAAPPPNIERSRGRDREAPPRVEPSRREGSGPSSRAEPRSSPPPSRAEPSRGGGSGGGNASPPRSRRPRGG